MPATQKGALQVAILQALKEFGRPVPMNTLWFRVQKSAPHSSKASVAQSTYELVRQKRVHSMGTDRNKLYSLPANNRMPETPRPKPEATINGRMPEEAKVEVLPPDPLAPPHATRVGQYTINTQGWIAADDQGTRIVLFLNVLEIDPETKHPRTKKLTFDQANELSSVRSWLALQTGPHTIGLNASLEAERDAALELAQAAEERAKEAEKRLEAIRKAAMGD